MEFHGVLPQLNKFSSGDGDINCTLRLGLPYYDEQSQEKQRTPSQKQTLPNLNIVGSYIQGIGKAENGETLSYLANLQLRACSPNTMPQTHSDINMYAYIEDPARILRTAGKKAVSYRCCNTCGLTKTPMWRKGPLGPQTLCNACGLRYARAIKRSAKRTCSINSA